MNFAREDKDSIARLVFWIVRCIVLLLSFEEITFRRWNYSFMVIWYISYVLKVSSIVTFERKGEMIV